MKTDSGREKGDPEGSPFFYGEQTQRQIQAVKTLEKACENRYNKTSGKRMKGAEAALRI